MRVKEMGRHERLVEDLVSGAWERHSQVKSDRSAQTLDRAGTIREVYFDEQE